MPCTYYETPEEIAASRSKPYTDRIEALTKERDRLTRLLCEATNLFWDDPQKDAHLSKELIAWRVEHDKQDAARHVVEAENKKRLLASATSKLTQAEIEAIGEEVFRSHVQKV